jgi:hypothetical protein
MVIRANHLLTPNPLSFLRDFDLNEDIVPLEVSPYSSENTAEDDYPLCHPKNSGEVQI